MPSIYLLDRAYRVAASQTGGVPARRVVVATSTGDCRLPAAANADSMLGVPTHPQPVPGRAVSVRKAGVCEVEAASAITAGAAVYVHGDTGRVRAVGGETSGTKLHCLGFAETGASASGQIIEVFLAPHQRTA